MTTTRLQEKKGKAHWSRWLHTYLSIVSFTILLFFALTGITLNHQASFSNHVKTRDAKKGDQVQISFKGPGYTGDGFIERATGKYELMETRLGFGAGGWC